MFEGILSDAPGLWALFTIVFAVVMCVWIGVWIVREMKDEGDPS